MAAHSAGLLCQIQTNQILKGFRNEPRPTIQRPSTILVFATEMGASELKRIRRRLSGYLNEPLRWVQKMLISILDTHLVEVKLDQVFTRTRSEQ